MVLIVVTVVAVVVLVVDAGLSPSAKGVAVAAGTAVTVAVEAGAAVVAAEPRGLSVKVKPPPAAAVVAVAGGAVPNMNPVVDAAVAVEAVVVTTGLANREVMIAA